MIYFRYIILFFIVFNSAQADTIYNLIKIPNLEIYDIKTTNKLRYLYAKQPFTIGVDNNINCYDPEKKTLDKKYKVIQKNLSRYNQVFLKKINLMPIGQYVLLIKRNFHVSRKQLNLVVKFELGLKIR